MVFKNCCDLKCRSCFFLAFRHFKKTSNDLSLVLFFFILLVLRKRFYKEGGEICLSPFLPRMNFLEMFCHAWTNPAVLCVLILLFVFLFALFMIVKLDSIKTFLYKESFAASEVKAFRKARDPANKQKSIFVSESLSPACNLFLPQLSKRCWRPHTERITWNSRKLRWGYFCSKLLFAWRDVYRCECQFASLFMLTQSCFTFCVSTLNFTCCKLHVSFCRFSVFILTACDTWSKFRDMASLTLLSYVGLRVQYQSLSERA